MPRHLLSSKAAAVAHRLYLWQRLGDNAMVQTRLLCSTSGSLPPSSAYHLRVHTGDVRGAGTRAQIFVEVKDDNGGHFRTQLRVGGEDVFRRNSVCEFNLRVPDSLGAVTEVLVGHDNSDVGAGWYLDCIELTPVPSSGGAEASAVSEGDDVGSTFLSASPAAHLQRNFSREATVFACGRWLGESESGGWSGPIERNLPMYSPADGALPGYWDVPPRCTLNRLANGLQPLVLRTGCAASPHPQKVQSGTRGRVSPHFGHAGDDAYSVSHSRMLRSEGNAALTTVGIADGVYAWRDRGIDVGAFSQGLVQSITTHCNTGTANDDDDEYSDNNGALRLKDVMDRAFKDTLSDGCEGSATCCVIALDGLHGELHSANLGDSGYAVTRALPAGERVLFRTPQQEHIFGYPFQLGHHDHSDKARDAELASMEVAVGDIVVAATDGLWDNLAESDIVDAIVKARAARAGGDADTTSGVGVAALAQELLKQAYYASLDGNGSTPYSLGASEEFHMVYSGGKPDDITVVVGIVEEDVEGQSQPS